MDALADRLSLELAARQLRDHSLRTTALERDEWGRRARAMAWWTMRGAFYENVTRGVVAGVRSPPARLCGRHHRGLRVPLGELLFQHEPLRC